MPPSQRPKSLHTGTPITAGRSIHSVEQAHLLEEQRVLRFVHLHATAGALTAADWVLLGNTDVLIFGGGSKIYNADEAAAVANQLNPKGVIKEVCSPSSIPWA